MDNKIKDLESAAICDLVDMTEILKDIDDGYIEVSFHKDDPSLGIYNYTPKTQFSREWTTTRKICRGLIIRRTGNIGEIRAKPFPKFFNHDEPDAVLPLPSRVALKEISYQVYDKLDGSLGIAYRDNIGDVHIASKGSFHSDQANFANEWLENHKNIRNQLEVIIGSRLTPCFEIIYPADRKVVDYHKAQKLMVIGFIAYNGTRFLEGINYPKEYMVAHRNFTGKWPHTLIEGDWDNREGYVVDWYDCKYSTGGRYKLKFPEYVRLHRIVTGLNEKGVWEILCEKGEPGITELKMSIPEEFHNWVDNLAFPMIKQAFSDVCMVRSHYMDMKVSGDFNRKNFALLIQEKCPELLGLAMLKFPELGDGTQMMKFAYRRLKPKGKK